jgi:hydroxymethylpyrimidine/phosphomethylpyrimidine kinase
MTIYLHSADNTRKPGNLNDPPPDAEEVAERDLNPPCVLVFNASDPSGAGGLWADALAMASVGAHMLPVVTGAYARDTAEIFDHFAFGKRPLPSRRAPSSKTWKSSSSRWVSWAARTP